MSTYKSNKHQSALSFYSKKPNNLEIDRIVVYKKGKMI